MTNFKNFITKTLLLCGITPIMLLADTPTAPSALALTALSGTSVSVAWGDNSSNEAGFKIFRNGLLVHTVAPNETSFVDTGLNPNTTYAYTVKAADSANTKGISINELVAGNVRTNLDPDFYNASDWIELYNSTNTAANIGGYYLSDDKNNPQQWKIPNGTTIAANSYLLVWADKKNISANALHTNFKLSSKKETVTLATSDGSVIDTVKYSKLKGDVSVQKGANTLVYMAPTPNATNRQAYVTQTRTTKPLFSLASGFYDNAQTVTLSHPSGAAIYYTTDGSSPTTNSTRYTQALQISSSTVLKARAIEGSKLPGEINTQSYLIGFATTLPVVSLSIDDKYLFDDMIGIYVSGSNGIAGMNCSDHMNDPVSNYKNYNQDWERPVSIEYFNDNGIKDIDIDAGLSISGQCSRYERKKSFSIELDSKFGDKSLAYSFYESKPNVDEIKDFKIRIGNSGYGARDILSTMLVDDGNLDVDYQAYQVVQMFMNGQYWGIYKLREKKGKSYLRNNYPALGKKIDIIGNGGEAIKSGDLVEYNKLQDYVESHNLAINANYQEVLTMIEEDNFIDYLVVMLYSANSDWIWNNMRMWREKKSGAKWRWMLDDLDDGFEQYNFDSFAFLHNSDSLMALLYKGLLQNATFKQKFKNRFNIQLNTTFAASNLIAHVDAYFNVIAPYTGMEKDRWNIYAGDFTREENALKEFARRRVSIVRGFLDRL